MQIQMNRKLVFYLKQSQNNRRAMRRFLISTTTLSIVYHTITLIRMFFPTNSIRDILVWFDMASRFLYLFLFSYLGITWFFQLSFFISTKVQNLRRFNLSLNWINFVIIVFTYILSAIMILHHINLLICGTIEEFVEPLSPHAVSLFWRYFYIFLFIGDSCCNFVMCMALSSLFFYQAGRLQAMMAVGEDESHYYDSEVSRILKNKKPEKVEPVRDRQIISANHIILYFDILWDSDVIKTTQGAAEANKETAVFGQPEQTSQQSPVVEERLATSVNQDTSEDKFPKSFRAQSDDFELLAKSHLEDKPEHLSKHTDQNRLSEPTLPQPLTQRDHISQHRHGNNAGLSFIEVDFRTVSAITGVGARGGQNLVQRFLQLQFINPYGEDDRSSQGGYTVASKQRVHFERSGESTYFKK